jgi:hypothetical protein
MKRQSKTLLAMALAVVANIGTARAELLLETIPPTRQLQQPDATLPARGEVRAVALQEQGGTPAAGIADEAAQVRQVIEEILAGAANIVLVGVDPEPREAAPEGYAKNLAIDPVKPGYTVRLALGAGKTKPMLRSEFLPVTLQIVDATGATLAEQAFEYRADDRPAFTRAVGGFLGDQLQLAGETAAPGALARPRLKVWMETEDGAAPRMGGRIARYYQARAKGYVSLYHFGSANTVQRIYPNKKEPYNFVLAGRTYRIPQRGYFQLQGPAGSEQFKAVFTIYPSNTLRTQEGDLQFKSDPLQVIPTHYPVLFATGDMMRFFALPEHLYTEVHVPYELQAAK